MPSLDDTIVDAESDVPLNQDLVKSGTGMPKTAESLRLLGAGQPYNPVKLPHPIGGHYREDE
jgi:hypothetical protein